MGCSFILAVQPPLVQLSARYVRLRPLILANRLLDEPLPVFGPAIFESGYTVLARKSLIYVLQPLSSSHPSS
ncbi:uncharacterized protein PGTG_22674 [Puccinia graminis f. sp. tritici CRL 75-36-700-3]|uniref:Uncharacterized protein n=1 Tax=Puccinia graminis f. sp. tritici (strain CRL 75-36-700-3 / race SCCL) TaxID=418459 RepID=H6QV85_PUCGT|nr:uncharacterized protein PGTG_22674 [Puccinia graminis f. sp. tritici CRL 75-36-700-3]EHS62786.1 hypothetical protein PGTG_22674 [Puccinia graminis f. sp. tritici CRL 75-36-700-3]